MINLELQRNPNHDMRLFTRLGAFTFGVVSLMHLLRLINGWEVTVGEAPVPMWVSGAGFALTFILCLGLMREAHRPARTGGHP
jgi:hypothetical protein